MAEKTTRFRDIADYALSIKTDDRIVYGMIESLEVVILNYVDSVVVSGFETVRELEGYLRSIESSGFELMQGEWQYITEEDNCE